MPLQFWFRNYKAQHKTNENAAQTGNAMKRETKTATATLVFCLLTTALTIPSVRSLTGTAKAQSQGDAAQLQSPFVRGRILVQFRPETAALHGRGLIEQSGAQDAREIPGIGVHVLELPAGADEEAFVHAFKSQPQVEFAELDRILPVQDVIPNDPSYGSEWHLPKIAAPTGWSSTTGSSGVTIAICDTGVE